VDHGHVTNEINQGDGQDGEAPAHGSGSHVTGPLEVPVPREELAIGQANADGHPSRLLQSSPPEWNLRELPEPLPRLRGGVIVSCQAGPGDPLHGASMMVAMARAAVAGGAVAIRANGPEDIAAIRAAVGVPIIGIWKVDIAGYDVRITPTAQHARLVATAGASIIALDATDRVRPDGRTVASLIQETRSETGLPVMADVSSVAEALAAQDAGADLVATTLSGYTGEVPATGSPNLELVARLARLLHVPVIAEGRIATPDEAARAIELGAYAVVVGHAVTRPQWITEQFVSAVRGR
jgi:N-acylglucosamine-6-phosphate 2-epimerase